MQRRLSSHPLVAFIGLHGPVADAKLSATESELRVETHVTTQQARLLLDFMRNALTPQHAPPRPAAPRLSPPGGAVRPPAGPTHNDAPR
jgi:hypothetical protein